jgi:transcriptional repressor NF-X1
MIMVSSEGRKSCLEAIPSCGQPCRKYLRCGVHFCKKSCHDGDCERCEEVISEKCECGSSSRNIFCYEK